MYRVMVVRGPGCEKGKCSVAPGHKVVYYVRGSVEAEPFLLQPCALDVQHNDAFLWRIFYLLSWYKKHNRLGM